MKSLLTNLENYLKTQITNLNGDFVKKNSGYDSAICDVLPDFIAQTSRYWDAYWNKENVYIEFKKGKSIWLDLVRYSEIKMEINDDAKTPTITLFFIPDNNKTCIELIIGIETKRLIESLQLSDQDAEYVIMLKEKVPRSLNAQASLTVNDVREIADFIVY